MGRCQLRSFTQRTEGRWEVLSASAIAKPTREQSARCLTWVTNERTEPPFATYSAGLNRGQSRAKQAAGPDSSRAKPCGTPQARCSSRMRAATNKRSGVLRHYKRFPYLRSRQVFRSRFNVLNTKGNRITYFGHSTFSLTTASGQVALIDPWVMTNPRCPDNLKKVPKLDVIFLSHAHSDHLGDLLALAKQHRPQMVAIFETCLWIGSKGFEDQTKPMGKGGTQKVAEFEVTM